MEKQQLTSEQYRRKMRTWKETRLPVLQREMAKRLLDKIGEIHNKILGIANNLPPARFMLDLDYETQLAILAWKKEESKLTPYIHFADLWVKHRRPEPNKIEFDISEEFELLCEGSIPEFDIFTQDHPKFKYSIIKV